MASGGGLAVLGEFAVLDGLSFWVGQAMVALALLWILMEEMALQEMAMQEMSNLHGQPHALLGFVV